MPRNYLPLDMCLFYSWILNRPVHVVSLRLPRGQALELPASEHLRCKPGCWDPYYQLDRSVQQDSCQLKVGCNILIALSHCVSLLTLSCFVLFCAYSPVSENHVWACFLSTVTNLKCPDLPETYPGLMTLSFLVWQPWMRMQLSQCLCFLTPPLRHSLSPRLTTVLQVLDSALWDISSLKIHRVN